MLLLYIKEKAERGDLGRGIVIRQTRRSYAPNLLAFPPKPSLQENRGIKTPTAERIARSPAELTFQEGLNR